MGDIVIEEKGDLLCDVIVWFFFKVNFVKFWYLKYGIEVWLS